MNAVGTNPEMAVYREFLPGGTVVTCCVVDWIGFRRFIPDSNPSMGLITA